MIYNIHIYEDIRINVSIYLYLYLYIEEYLILNT